jgi:Spy/CpxP family protein refolding chaperone
MKAENKHTVMVWTIVVLAIMNVTTLATIVFHQYKTEKNQTTGIAQKQLEADAEKFSGRYFRDQLNLSSEQMDKFREFNRPFRMQARSTTIELAEKRKAMLNEMVAPKSDTTRLNALSDSIGNLHSHLKKLTYGYYLNIKGICDTEQQKKLEQLFRDMFTNDATMAFPGRGGMQGMQMREQRTRSKE